MPNNVLLLTSTISPHQNIQNKSSQDLDTNRRKQDYLRALIYYITQSDFDEIVFCENSNTYLKEFDDVKKIAEIFGKKIEFLIFQ
jgi:hypothetical protein